MIDGPARTRVLALRHFPGGLAVVNPCRLRYTGPKVDEAVPEQRTVARPAFGMGRGSVNQIS
jgi:hypothetical protein